MPTRTRRLKAKRKTGLAKAKSVLAPPLTTEGAQLKEKMRCIQRFGSPKFQVMSPMLRRFSLER